MNLKAIRHSLRYLFDQLKISAPYPIIWFYYPQQHWVTKIFRNGISIYEIYDNISNIYGSENPQDIKIENSLRDSIDLLITTSQKLHEKYAHHYRDSILMGNGLSRVQYNRFNDSNVKNECQIEKISGPRIGYAGAISERLDWELIHSLAKANPGWNFIFAGKIYNRKLIARAEKLPNVHFTGYFEYDRMPSILRCFDIGILPYLDTEFFQYLNPLKYYEYSAAGLPIVSSPIPELEQFPQEQVRIVQNRVKEWTGAIKTQLDIDRAAVSRIGREIAGKFIWEDIAGNLFSKISTILEKSTDT